MNLEISSDKVDTKYLAVGKTGSSATSIAYVRYKNRNQPYLGLAIY